MNTFVADPHWGWWIIWYFFLGGIAAGAYFVAALVELFGTNHDRAVARAGYLITAPLVAVCGVLLIADLNHPARFWHMLADAETWRPVFKPTSPMSVGAWALLLFGAASGVSFAGTVMEGNARKWPRLAAWCARLHRGMWGRIFDVIGTACGFFIASYTGALLTATNQPIWSDGPWLAALFLASSAATGLAAIQFLLAWLARLPMRVPEPEKPAEASGAFAIRLSRGTHARLQSLEPWLWGLELLTAGLFVSSLGSVVARDLAATPVGWTFLGTFGLGIGVPVFLRWYPGILGRFTAMTVAAAVLVGGFLLRYAVITAPATTIRRAELTNASNRVSGFIDNEDGMDGMYD